MSLPPHAPIHHTSPILVELDYVKCDLIVIIILGVRVVAWSVSETGAVVSKTEDDWGKFRKWSCHLLQVSSLPFLH